MRPRRTAQAGRRGARRDDGRGAGGGAGACTVRSWVAAMCSVDAAAVATSASEPSAAIDAAVSAIVACIASCGDSPDRASSTAAWRAASPVRGSEAASVRVMLRGAAAARSATASATASEAAALADAVAGGRPGARRGGGPPDARPAPHARARQPSRQPADRRRGHRLRPLEPLRLLALVLADGGIHEAAPDRDGELGGIPVGDYRARHVVADPHAGHQARGVADEPRVLVIVGRPRLSRRPLRESEPSHPRGRAPPRVRGGSPRGAAWVGRPRRGDTGESTAARRLLGIALDSGFEAGRVAHRRFERQR